MIMPITTNSIEFSVRNISLSRGRQKVLSDVNLSISPGEFVAVVGPNGAGKSSLLKVFSGDLLPDSGEVRLGDQPMSDWNLNELAKQRAVLPQQSELLFPLPVRDVVLMGRAPHNGGIDTYEDEEIADEAMRATDVQEFQGRYYDQLSGGEKQRVQLARVLAQVWPHPGTPGKFLLLDEPTASLDLSHQHVFLQTVRRFSRAGLGVFVVLHDLNLAMQYADRVMVLYHGHSVTCDVPEKALIPELIREVFKVDAQVLKETPTSPPLLRFHLP